MNWKKELLELKKIFSDNQLAILLGLSHGAIAGRLIKFKESSFENEIINLSGRLKNGENPRKILFEKWSQRFVNNHNGLICRKLRETLNITMSKFPKALGANISSYETGTNIMPNSLFNRIKEEMEKICNCSLSEKGNHFRKLVQKNLLPEQRQVISFMKVSNKLPSVVKLLPQSKNLNGTDIHDDIINKLIKINSYTFTGAKLLPRNFNGKRGADIDAIVLTKKLNIGVEIKSWRKISVSTLNRRLKFVNVHLRDLRTRFPEIHRTACIVPLINMSESWKRKFKINGNLLLDRNDLAKGISLDILSKQIIFPFSNTDLRKKALEKNYSFMFRDEEIMYLRCLRRVLGISLNEVCKNLFNGSNKWKTIIASLETGKRNNLMLKSSLKNFLTNFDISERLIKDEIEEERKRWELVFRFPMAVGLTNPQNNQDLELEFEKTLQKDGWITARNVLINDKQLSKMTLNGHHPEADIIAIKSDKFMVVECKDGKNITAKSQLVFEIKRKIQRLSQWLNDIEFDKAVIVVHADLSSQSWNTLDLFAKERNVKLVVI